MAILTLIVALLPIYVVQKLGTTVNPITTKCFTKFKQDQAAYSHSHPNWIRQKEILAVKITQETSYPEARKIIESVTRQSEYLAVVYYNQNL